MRRGACFSRSHAVCGERCARACVQPAAQDLSGAIAGDESALFPDGQSSTSIAGVNPTVPLLR